MTLPGFAVLYRWRLKPGQESQFIAAWSFLTCRYRDQHGAMGSRLHRAEDGTWYAYAQWPSPDARTIAFANESPDHEAQHHADQMHAAVAEYFPEVRLAPVADYLICPSITDQTA
ncbi:antibiotic biosynthesis monooxygenase [Chitinimonas sp. BJYL2]|uniref:antibiotic biosynthesis monooxygenase family protein n=1 Tax=Chitinimonas sp. BJYL2 TaxID=2976696 RepID=UPI0022B5B4A3|nr:antibiotic biosynthesis monooxygenase [Chitinimonas sp. BJYL2]